MLMSECSICGFEGYDDDRGCEHCGHYDEYKAKRKLKVSRREKRLDRRFR